MEFRRELLAKWLTGGTTAQGYVAAPGSGATITLWDSGSNEGGNGRNSKGVRWRRLIINTFTSHASAASGMTIEESSDDGANWDIVPLGSVTIAATTYTKTSAAISAPRVRVRYINTANVLTAWRGSVIGDEYDNNPGV